MIYTSAHLLPPELDDDDDSYLTAAVPANDAPADTLLDPGQVGEAFASIQASPREIAIEALPAAEEMDSVFFEIQDEAEDADKLSLDKGVSDETAQSGVNEPQDSKALLDTREAANTGSYRSTSAANVGQTAEAANSGSYQTAEIQVRTTTNFLRWLSGGLLIGKWISQLYFPSLREIGPRKALSELGRRMKKLPLTPWQKEEGLKHAKQRRVMLFALAIGLSFFYFTEILEPSPGMRLETHAGEIAADLPSSHSNWVESHSNVSDTTFGRVIYSASSARHNTAPIRLFMLVHFEPISGETNRLSATDLSPAVDSIIHGMNGTVTYTDELPQDAVSGLEFEFEGFDQGTSMVGRGRIFGANGEYILLLFAGENESSKTNPDGIDFLDSFSYTAWI